MGGVDMQFRRRHSFSPVFRAVYFGLFLLPLYVYFSLH